MELALGGLHLGDIHVEEADGTTLEALALGAGTGRANALAMKIAKLREQRQVSAALLGQLEESGDGQISLTDPDEFRSSRIPR